MRRLPHRAACAASRRAVLHCAERAARACISRAPRDMARQAANGE
ncbi:hypothetical protein BURPS406E_K0196 [Burkholderia pseudomallei 406e]|nr:hypothetical protein BURPS406E_K0196 [Burkholderia pseudomallei 406e]